jgi:predicted flavoprotein YhiN
MSFYHGDSILAEQVFSNWQGSEIFFANLGLICKSDSQGRLYPYSNTANSVLDALRFCCEKTQIITDTPCTEIIIKNNEFVINGSIYAKKVIWACGNSDFAILRSLGHSVIKPHPALCPIITDKALTRPLKGLRVYAECKAIVNEKVIKKELGEVQFNENSLSGICIMNLSRLVRDYGNSLTISLNIAPDFTLEQLREIPLTGLFHSRIVSILQKQPRQSICETIKNWKFPVTGVAQWNQSQILSGGIPADELNTDLSSKKCPNLFIIGESVNIDGDCGGYNLEWAWASAFSAATSKKL